MGQWSKENDSLLILLLQKGVTTLGMFVSEDFFLVLFLFPYK